MKFHTHYLSLLKHCKYRHTLLTARRSQEGEHFPLDFLFEHAMGNFTSQDNGERSVKWHALRNRNEIISEVRSSAFEL